MNPLTHARAMAAYNRWMNERIYECCARLSDEERKRDAGAFFKSIHGTLNHLLLGDRIWLGRFKGRPFRVESLAQELYADFAELRAERASTDAEIIAWVDSLSEKRFEGELAYISMVNPQPMRYPFWFAVTGFFNHETHHRGQVTTLLFQRGIDPGITDLIWLPEFQQAR